MKNFLIILISFSSYGSLNATHILGGEITWERVYLNDFLNLPRYRFTLVLYRDCSGANAPNGSQEISNNLGITIKCYPISTEILPNNATQVCAAMRNFKK